jgi:DNA topoisomerase-1
MGFKLFLEQEQKEQPKEYSEAELKARQNKKEKSVDTLAQDIGKLRRKVSTMMKSDNEKERLTGLVLSIMLKTGERVGNDESAKEGHHGVTGLKAKHIKFDNGDAILNYTGKSGVDHEKKLTDSSVVDMLKKLVDGKQGGDFVFTTEDGFKIKNDRVNRVLKDFGITAKDIRGFSANRWMIRSLNQSNIEKEEKDRKKKFLEILKNVAEKVGHTPSMLRNSYLLPKIEKMYIEQGKVASI